MKLIKDVEINNYQSEYRYTDDDKYHIVFNLTDNTQKVWKFDNKEKMDNVLDEIKKQLSTIEIQP